jgi:hypothetical protein
MEINSVSLLRDNPIEATSPAWFAVGLLLTNTPLDVHD